MTMPRPESAPPGTPGALDLLGLSTPEQALYEELLTRPPVTAADLDELATELGWDTDDTRAVLDRLCALELVTRLATTPPLHTASPPYNALNARLDTRSHGLTRAHRRMLDLSARFYRHHADSGAGGTAQAGGVGGPEYGYSADPLVTVVHGQEAITRALEEAGRTIRHELLGFDAPPYSGPRHAGSGNVIRPGDNLSGVTYRVIYDRRSLDSPYLMAALLETEHDPAHASRVADVPVKLALIDGRIGLLPLVQEGRPVEVFLVIRDRALVAVLRALFHLYWERATPVWLRGSTTTQDLSEADRELLVLLTSGHTDRLIAELKGWHERTVRRRVASLMGRIGADTRFQAGYRAVAEGWLEFDANAAALASPPSTASPGSTPDIRATPDGPTQPTERP